MFCIDLKSLILFCFYQSQNRRFSVQTVPSSFVSCPSSSFYTTTSSSVATNVDQQSNVNHRSLIESSSSDLLSSSSSSTPKVKFSVSFPTSDGKPKSAAVVSCDSTQSTTINTNLQKPPRPSILKYNPFNPSPSILATSGGHKQDCPKSKFSFFYYFVLYA